MNDDLTPEERWLADALAEISRRRSPGRGFTPRPAGRVRRVGSLVLVGVLSVALVSAAILLPRFVFPIAHGRANASQGSGPFGTLAPASTLCEPGVAVTHLTVHRTPQNHIKFNFPADVVVASSSQARMVADAVCALPRMPSGTFSCPLDLGIVYHLSFWAGGVEFGAVSVGATGCQVVRGLGVQRWVARSPDFWRTLGVAMGLTRPDLATFQGPPP